MFEKDAEEYFETECLHSYADTEEQLKEDVVSAFQKGAEFGYNKGYNLGYRKAMAVISEIEHAEKDKANGWHSVKDGDLPEGDEHSLKGGIHRKILLQDRYGNIYTGNYYPKDKCHKEDCFAVEFLVWGLQGNNFCAKEQISKWKEIE